MPNDSAPYAFVADDDPLLMMDASDILVDAGFRPLQAGEVAEALVRLEEFDGDVRVLFTNVQMPGEWDGLDLAREVAQRWPEVKILVASGNHTPKDGELPDAAVFIGKPFSAHRPRAPPGIAARRREAGATQAESGGAGLTYEIDHHPGREHDMARTAEKRGKDEAKAAEKKVRATGKPAGGARGRLQSPPTKSEAASHPPRIPLLAVMRAVTIRLDA